MARWPNKVALGKHALKEAGYSAGTARRWKSRSRAGSGLAVLPSWPIRIDLVKLIGYTVSQERYNQMATVKTAISLPKTLFEQVETLAREMKVSRSRVFVLALENLIRDYQDKQLFDRINKAFEDAPPDKAEQLRLRQIRRQHRRLAEGDW
jgi:hypothetical protein